MATIDDFGEVNQPLSEPALGGPTGWAAAVRDYIKDLPAAIAGKVSKAGDTMTGELRAPDVSAGSIKVGASADIRGLITVEEGMGLAIANAANTALTTLGVGNPTANQHATPKSYVDANPGTPPHATFSSCDAAGVSYPGKWRVAPNHGGAPAGVSGYGWLIVQVFDQSILQTYLDVNRPQSMYQRAGTADNVTGPWWEFTGVQM